MRDFAVLQGNHIPRPAFSASAQVSWLAISSECSCSIAAILASKNFMASILRITIVFAHHTSHVPLHPAIFTEGTSNYKEVRLVLPPNTPLAQQVEWNSPPTRIFSRSASPLFRSARLQPGCWSRPKAPRLRDRLPAAARFPLRAPRLLHRTQSILERRQVECRERAECPSHASPTPARHRERSWRP